MKMSKRLTMTFVGLSAIYGCSSQDLRENATTSQWSGGTRYTVKGCEMFVDRLGVDRNPNGTHSFRIYIKVNQGTFDQGQDTTVKRVNMMLDDGWQQSLDLVEQSDSSAYYMLRWSEETDRMTFYGITPSAEYYWMHAHRIDLPDESWGGFPFTRGLVNALENSELEFSSQDWQQLPKTADYGLMGNPKVDVGRMLNPYQCR